MRMLLPILLLVAVGVVLTVGTPAKGEVCMGRFVTGLEGRTKYQRLNAKLALREMNGAVIAPGKVFSFNDKVGTWSRDAGYRKAPVSFNGQLVSEWGGGVCQASTTLYNAVLLSGMEIVERHPHHHAALYAPPGRDAAVAFHGIDLRFRNPYPFPVRISTKHSGDRLSVAIFGRSMPKVRPRIVTEMRDVVSPGTREVRLGGDFGHVRNSGKPGFEVATYRIFGDKKHLLSVDSYPAMTRVVEIK